MSDSKLKVYLASLWLILTTSLTVWWMYFALGLVSKLESGDRSHQTMLLLEGATLLFLLIAGGGTLIYLITREKKRTELLRQFFAAFSHDMKTAVASLRLQTESLQQDLPMDSSSGPLLKRLISDTSRILVATDNSLFLAQSEKIKLFKESIELGKMLRSMADSWPQLKFAISGDATIVSDRRAIQIIFENLIQNSLAHGEATEVRIVLESNNGQCRIEMTDNGHGFEGEVESLGTAFHRHTTTSGSGLGLSIVKSLLGQLGGEGPYFKKSSSGFKVEVLLPGEFL